MAGYAFGGYWSIGAVGSALFVYALAAMGMSVVSAFHLHLFLLFASAPAAIYIGARLFDLDRRESAIAASLTSLAWFLDPCVRWEWLVGMFSFASASYLCVPMAALLYRFIARGSLASFVAFAAVAIFASLLHPVSGATMILPAMSIFALYRDKLDARRVAFVAGFVVVIAAISYSWIAPLLESRGDLLDHAVILQGGVREFFVDIFGGKHRVSGSPFETIFTLRRAVYVAAAFGLVIAYRADRRRAMILIAAVVPLVPLIYLGSYSTFVANLQPYRFMVPLLFFATIPASVAVVALARRAKGRGVGMKAALGFAAALLVAGMGYDFKLANVELFAGGESLPREAGKLHPASVESGIVADWLNRNAKDNGRVFVDNWAISTSVQAKTGREIIGGPHFHVPLKQAFANLDGSNIFGRDIHSFSEAELKARFEAFDIKWSVVLYPDIQAMFESMPDTFRRVAFVELTSIDILMRPGYRGSGPIRGYAIYETNIAPNRFMAGSGSVVAGLNSLTIYSPSRGELILKYHWIDGLKTDSGVKIERVDGFADPAGFIRIFNEGADKITIGR